MCLPGSASVSFAASCCKILFKTRTIRKTFHDIFSGFYQVLVTALWHSCWQQRLVLCLTSEGIILILQRGATTLQNVQGYDVWLGNFRGNHESREHVNLDPDVDSDYWQFSWDEMAK